MNKRPTSVTIIAWFIIVTCALSIVITPINFRNPEVIAILEKSPVPVNVQLALGVFIASLNLICGVFMLMGKNWARLLYVTVAVLGFGFSVITSPMKMMLIPGLLVFVLIVVLLFMPGPSAFFTGKTSATPPPLS